MLNDNDRPSTKRLQKFFMHFIDQAGESKQYQCESTETDGSGLDSVKLPFNFGAFNPSSFLVRFHAEYGASDQIDDLEFFKYIIFGDQYVGAITPEEKDMFGNEAIPSSRLYSKACGVWTMNGFRKFELTIFGLPEETSTSDCNQKACLYWYRLDSTDIVPVFEDEIRCLKSTLRGSERNTSTPTVWARRSSTTISASRRRSLPADLKFITSIRRPKRTSFTRSPSKSASATLD